MRGIGLEMAAAVALLAMTAMLTHTPPHVVGTAAVRQQPWHGERVLPSGLSATLSVSPAQAGTNTLELTLKGKDGRPLAPLAVSAELRPADTNAQPLERPLTLAQPGQYRLDRIELPMDGRWAVHIVVLLNEFEETGFEFELDATPPRPQQP